MAVCGLVAVVIATSALILHTADQGDFPESHDHDADRTVNAINAPCPRVSATDEAQSPDDDTVSVLMCLEWIARETGMTLRFEPPGVEHDAQISILVGLDGSGLTPMQLLSIIETTTHFEIELRDDATILIQRR